MGLPQDLHENAAGLEDFRQDSPQESATLRDCRGVGYEEVHGLGSFREHASEG